MKKIFYFFFLLVVLSFSSCELVSSGGKATMDQYYYCLNISIFDTDGNDLVEQLKAKQWLPHDNQSFWTGDINPDSYNLDIQFSNYPPSYSSEAKIYYSIAKYDGDYSQTSTFGSSYTEGDGKWYLIQSFPCSLPVYVTNEKGERIQINPVQDHIKYTISCPSVFGDDLEHEITAYWDDAEGQTKLSDNIPSRFPECIRVEYEGKTYTPVKVDMTPSLTQEYQEKMGLKTSGYYQYFVDIVLDR